MPGIVVTPRGIGSLLERHERERQQRVKDALFESARAGATFLRTKLPKDQGPLQESCQAHRTENGAQIRIDAPYASYIEAGTRPHTPPLGPLIAWVARHVGELQLEGPGDVRRVAVAIQQKIAREGTEPKWVIRGSLDELKAIHDRTLSAALRLPLSAR